MGAVVDERTGRDHSTDRPELVELLWAQVEALRSDRDAWREQARRSDYLLSGAMERTRELEGRLRELEAARRGFWRRLFGG